MLQLLFVLNFCISMQIFVTIFSLDVLKKKKNLKKVKNLIMQIEEKVVCY